MFLACFHFVFHFFLAIAMRGTKKFFWIIPIQPGRPFILRGLRTFRCIFKTSFMKYVFYFLLIFSVQKVYTQELDVSTRLFMQLGATYIPVDNNGGIVLGLRIGKPDGKYSIALRNDIIPDFGRVIVTTNSGSYYSPSLTLLALQMNTYADAIYSWRYKQEKQFDFSIGYGWISTGDGYYGIPSKRFESSGGYSAITSSIRWKPSWFTLEIRGNIPISQPSLTGGDDQFPIVVSLFYDFIPGGK